MEPKDPWTYTSAQYKRFRRLDKFFYTMHDTNAGEMITRGFSLSFSDTFIFPGEERRGKVKVM